MLFTVTLSAQPKVKTGIEVLRESGFEALKGLRVGLVTNPSGVDSRLKSTIDILASAPEVKLVALYGPEHGVRGNVYAGDEVTDETDPATGIQVWSLYGKTRKPTTEMLAGIDAVVYDIQDIGCRSYTFISTLGLVMEACGEMGIDVIVLDRPNPLGGRKIEGNLVESGYESFISRYPIPYVYGMTVGEFAKFLVGEGIVNCNLTVIPMEGWSRDMTFADTGLPWVPTSPHIPQAETALFYPVSGILGELSGYINTGIGYTLPFQIFGGSWVTDAEAFARKLNAMGMEGIVFRPVTFTPFYGAEKGKIVRGVQPHITDYDAVRLSEVGFNVIQAVYEMYPDHPAFGVSGRKYRMFDICVGSGRIRELFGRRHNFDDVRPYWRKDEEEFRLRSSRYYIY